MATRDVLVKQSSYEVGIGSLDAKPVWESDPTDEGAIVRLDISIDGRYFLSFTDAEEFDGAYTSVEVTPKDVVSLKLALERIAQLGVI